MVSLKPEHWNSMSTHLGYRLVEHLLYATKYFRGWGPSCEQDRQGP